MAGPMPNPPAVGGWCCVSPGFPMCWCSRRDRVVRAWAAGAVATSTEHRAWLLEYLQLDAAAAAAMTDRDLAAALLRVWDGE